MRLHRTHSGRYGKILMGTAKIFARYGFVMRNRHDGAFRAVNFHTAQEIYAPDYDALIWATITLAQKKAGA